MAHPEQRDLEATADVLTGWLRERLPDAPDLELRGLSAPSENGFSSDTLLADLVQKDGGEESSRGLVIRIQPRGFNVFSSYDLTLQWRVMDALRATDVPVPQMLWHEWDETTLGAPFYVMDRIDGWVPSDRPPMHTAGHLAEVLSPDERAAVWWSGLETMARIHRLDPLALGLGFLAAPELGTTPLAQHLAQEDAYFSWATGERARYPLIERALDWLKRERPDEGDPRLCWGDSRIANQIYRGTECVGVLDWEMARLGEPEQDLAWWITTDRCFTEGIDVPRLEGMPDHDATVSRWESLVGRPARNLDYYEVLALLRFTVVMARLGLQMKHYGLAPEEADFDVTNLVSMTLERKLGELGS